MIASGPRNCDPLPAVTVSGERGGRPVCFDCGRGRGWWTGQSGMRFATCRRVQDGPHQHLCQRCFAELSRRQSWAVLLVAEAAMPVESDVWRPTPSNPAGFGPQLLRYFAEIGARG